MPRGKGGKTRYAKSAARAKQRVQNAKTQKAIKKKEKMK